MKGGEGTVFLQSFQTHVFFFLGRTIGMVGSVLDLFRVWPMAMFFFGEDVNHQDWLKPWLLVDIPLGDVPVVQTHGFSRPLDVLNGFKGPTVQPSGQVADKRYQESTGFPAWFRWWKYTSVTQENDGISCVCLEWSQFLSCLGSHMSCRDV